jgi:hypothetical protein
LKHILLFKLCVIRECAEADSKLVQHFGVMTVGLQNIQIRWSSQLFALQRLVHFILAHSRRLGNLERNNCTHVVLRFHGWLSSVFTHRSLK